MAGVGWPRGRGTLLAMLTSDVCQGYHTHQPPKRGCHLQFQVPARCEKGCPLSPLLFGLYLDALEGRLDDRECDAPALVDVHVWLLLFTDDLVLTLESEVGLQQQLYTLQQLCVKRGLIVNVEKTKAMVFNSIDPCQKFVFKGDAIKKV